jgi:NADH-quinone oxidoreductase subunit M
MNDIPLPFLETAILVAIFGAVWVGRIRDAERARSWSLVLSTVVLACVGAAWFEFRYTGDGRTLLSKELGRDFLVVEELNAPLLMLAALLYLMTTVATSRIRVRRFSFSWTLASEAILLATLGCKEPWGVVALLAAGTLPPFFELRSRHRPWRLFALHMGLFVVLLVAGWAVVEAEGGLGVRHSWLGLILLLGAILLRCGLFPFHVWVTDLFEHATFGSALLFVSPMVGAYAAVRLVLPIAPDWALRVIGLVALFTALYCAGMALVQREGRRFFCYVFLSHSALVLVGMDTIAHAEKGGVLGLTGGLCVWLSVSLALAGFGLTIRALESRHGRLSLSRYHGLYDYTPMLAVGFLMMGLASLGFPGTFGFLGSELLVDGAVMSYAFNVGLIVVVVAALNGVAIVRAYFLLFTGTKHVSSVPLSIGRRERGTVLALILLILLGGLFPQPAVDSRYKAAVEIRDRRRDLFGPTAPAEEPDDVPRLALERDVPRD